MTYSVDLEYVGQVNDANYYEAEAIIPDNPGLIIMLSNFGEFWRITVDGDSVADSNEVAVSGCPPTDLTWTLDGGSNVWGITDVTTSLCCETIQNPFNAIESKACDPTQGSLEYLYIPLQSADYSNPDQFKPCSWTIGYNPMLDGWISYYSYKPNYYIGYNDYFQSGVNTFGDKFGLWSHLPYLSSYQVFYGELYPFIVEFPMITQYVNSMLSNVQYWLDVRKYYNEHNYTDIFGVGFNKAVVYNSFQNTGLLQLVHQETHNIRQNLEYPRHNLTNIEILQTEINGRWAFNYLYNAIKIENAGLPIWREDCAQIEKVLDDRLLEYKPVWKDYLRGDYFLVRLIQDKESRFKFLTRFIINEREMYND